MSCMKFKKLLRFRLDTGYIKNVHKNTQNIQYKQEPCNVSFLHTPMYVLGVD